MPDLLSRDKRLITNQVVCFMILASRMEQAKRPTRARRPGKGTSSKNEGSSASQTTSGTQGTMPMEPGALSWPKWKLSLGSAVSVDDTATSQEVQPTIGHPTVTDGIGIDLNQLAGLGSRKGKQPTSQGTLGPRPWKSIIKNINEIIEPLGKDAERIMLYSSTTQELKKFRKWFSPAENMLADYLFHSISHQLEVDQNIAICAWQRHSAEQGLLIEAQKAEVDKKDKELASLRQALTNVDGS